MVNRGFDILPLVADDIHYVLAESILTHTDETSGQFAFFSSQTTSQVAAQLHRVAARTPQLQILTLDYWNMDDVNGLERIYAAHRAAGFVPYVTTPDLTTYTPEPARTRKNR
jgi:polysaccharide biosynthesis protein PelA